MITTRRIITGLALAGALVSQCPAAHADPDTQYIVDLASAGLPMGTPAQEVYVGQLVCQNMAAGMSLSDAIVRLMTGAGVTAKQGVAIVGYAVRDMCPQYINQQPAASAPAPSSQQPVGPVTIASAIA